MSDVPDEKQQQLLAKLDDVARAVERWERGNRMLSNFPKDLGAAMQSTLDLADRQASTQFLVMTSVGYAGLFGLWTLTRGQISATSNLLVGLLLLLSVSMYAFGVIAASMETRRVLRSRLLSEMLTVEERFGETLDAIRGELDAMIRSQRRSLKPIGFLSGAAAVFALLAYVVLSYSLAAELLASLSAVK